MQDKKKITDFFNEEYLDFAMYTVENRAIPSVIDGFKPTQRKIIYIANKSWKTGNEKPLKVFQLGGRVADMAMYHHGDSSLNSSIIGLAQSFKNSMPLLDEIGQFGSLRSPEAGAPRYISTRINKNFKLLYKDFELLTPTYDEGIEVEPKYFLPIIPTVLLNGSSGIAVGFSTNILNRNPLDLIDRCIKVLNNKKIKNINPWWKSYNGKIELNEDGSYSLYGIHDIKNTTTVEITELPPGMTYDKYDNHLNKLQEKKIIQSYDDNCSKNIRYVIKFTRQELDKQIKKNNLERTLKLVETVTENLTCLSENNKLLIFNNTIEIIEYFVKFRLIYYQKRKDYLIDSIGKDILVLTNKAKFIKSIIDEKLIVNNQPKNIIESKLIELKFDKYNDSYNYLLSMLISSLTKENYTELLKNLESKKAELNNTRYLRIDEMYEADLKELQKSIKKTFSQ